MFGPVCIGHPCFLLHTLPMDFRDLTQKIFSTASPKMLKDWIRNLLQKIEENEINISKVEAENEALKNKIRRMQGLSTKPKFSKSKDKTSDLETEDDNDDDGKAKTSNKRKDAAKKNRKTKKDIHIDKKEKITVDREMFDESFIYKGTRKVIVQELLFQSNNIEFEIERYYSPEFGYLEAELPQKYRNGFLGPCLKTWILTVYYQGNLTIKKMRSILLGINIDISLREINRIINKEYSPLVDEYDEARKEAIKRANFQQIDDTGANLCFKNAFTTVTCNPYFTGLYTSLKKNRKNAVIALTGGKQKLLYKLNDHAIMTAYLANKSLRMQLTLENLKSERLYDDDDIDDFLKCEEFEKLRPMTIEMIKTSMLIGAFHDSEMGYVGKALVSDDAPQFNQLYDDHLLCWPHELRHYKDLDPQLFEHRQALNSFFSEVKDIYKMLKKWIQTRNEEMRKYLFGWFNELFKRPTGYRLLDQRKKKSFDKMDKLLAPLFTSIELPLDNNESERDLRCRVTKRKVSLFNRTIEGARAWDFYLGLMKTCQKNDLNFYQFLEDRLSCENDVPQLSEIIRHRRPQI